MTREILLKKYLIQKYNYLLTYYFTQWRQKNRLDKINQLAATKWIWPMSILIGMIPFRRLLPLYNIRQLRLTPFIVFIISYIYNYYKAYPCIKWCKIDKTDASKFTWDKNCYCKSAQNIQYTRWVYREIMFLMPLLPFSRLARRIATINSVGLGVGIHCLYAGTNYKLLRELGDIFFINEIGWKRQPLYILLSADAVIHLLPWMLCHLYFRDLHFLSARVRRSSIFIGMMTGISHCSWCYLLTNQWNVEPLYKEKDNYSFIVKTKYTPTTIQLGWVSIFASHMFGAILYN
tara:strand:+ start:9804 stop:10673 length:870 start_codon:yes stop_codon:yes gene_type:complete